MPVFTQRRGMLGAAGRVQRFYLNGGTDVVLQSAVDSVTGEPFTAFNKTKKIVVRITSDVSASSELTDAFRILPLTGYFRVEIVVDSGVTIGGYGGRGGFGGDYPTHGTPGVKGGDCILNNHSDPTNLTLENFGSILAGGGGGGGGGRSQVQKLANKDCDTETREPIGGDGGRGAGVQGAASAGQPGETLPWGPCFNGSVTGADGGNGGNIGSNGQAGDCGLFGSFGGVVLCSAGPGGAGGLAGFWLRGSSGITVITQGTTSGRIEA